jgi:hypothetical protein
MPITDSVKFSVDPADLLDRIGRVNISTQLKGNQVMTSNGPSAAVKIARPAMKQQKPIVRKQKQETSTDQPKAKKVKLALTDEHKERIERMICGGRDPVEVRAVFGACPERVRLKHLAEKHAKAFKADLLRVETKLALLEDEEAARKQLRAERAEIEAERRRMRAALNLSQQRSDAADEASESQEAKPAPKKRKQYFGLALTAVIRICGSKNMTEDQTRDLLKQIGVDEIHPSTLVIQLRKGVKGQSVPKVPAELKKLLTQKPRKTGAKQKTGKKVSR